MLGEHVQGATDNAFNLRIFNHIAWLWWASSDGGNTRRFTKWI